MGAPFPEQSELFVADEHEEHDDDPASDVDPAAHAVHAAILVEPTELVVPAAQFVHDALGVALYVPAAHDAHAVPLALY